MADTCLLVLFTKKTTYEQFSAVYLTPKSGTDGFTFCVNLCCSGVKFALLVIAIPPRITTCVRIFVLCDLGKKVFSNILEQRQLRTKPTDHSKEGRVGKGKLGNSTHASSGASTVERVRSAADDNQVQPGFMCSSRYTSSKLKGPNLGTQSAGLL